MTKRPLYLLLLVGLAVGCTAEQSLGVPVDEDRTTRNQLRTVRQASRLLEISPHTLRAWIAAGKVEAVRLGRAVRVPMVEIERLIADGRIPRRVLR